MARIKVLVTPGCRDCAMVKGMLDEMNIEYEIVDITKNPKILEKYQIMTAPGIVINERLEFSGVPTKEELKKKILE